MSVLLPPNPSIDQLKRQARELLAEFEAGSEEVLRRVQTHRRRFRDGPDRTKPLTLQEAQWVVAREYGFSTWAELKLRVQDPERPTNEEDETIKLLTKEGLERARAFVSKTGRVVDQRLLEFDFNEGSASAVVDALAGYQNDDGGFGRALEADIRMQESSVRATTVAFQVLCEVNAPGDHACVQAGIKYLLDTYDSDAHVWPIVPSVVNDAPHAPWWDYGGTEGTFGAFRLNPTAEVLGYLYDYSDKVPDSLLSELTETIVARVAKAPEKMEMHDLMCCIRLAETKSLPESARTKILPKLKQSADRVVDRDPDRWSEYSVKPVSLAPWQASSLASLLEADIQQNLDFEINAQGDDGAWRPNWSWSGDAWQQAELEWKSHITVNMLRSLRAFGRIESQ